MLSIKIKSQIHRCTSIIKWLWFRIELPCIVKGSQRHIKKKRRPSRAKHTHTYPIRKIEHQSFNLSARAERLQHTVMEVIVSVETCGRRKKKKKNRINHMTHVSQSNNINRIFYVWHIFSFFFFIGLVWLLLSKDLPNPMAAQQRSVVVINVQFWHV